MKAVWTLLAVVGVVLALPVLVVLGVAMGPAALVILFVHRVCGARAVRCGPDERTLVQLRGDRGPVGAGVQLSEQRQQLQFHAAEQQRRRWNGHPAHRREVR